MLYILRPETFFSVNMMSGIYRWLGCYLNGFDASAQFWLLGIVHVPQNDTNRIYLKASRVRAADKVARYSFWNHLYISFSVAVSNSGSGSTHTAHVVIH